MRIHSGRARWWMLVAFLGIAVPIFIFSKSASATDTPANPPALPPGLQPTQLNITNDATHRYGEPEIAVNPTDPNNLVYFVMSNMLTYACEGALEPNCTMFENGVPCGRIRRSRMDQHASLRLVRSWADVVADQLPRDSGIQGFSRRGDRSLGSALHGRSHGDGDRRWDVLPRLGRDASGFWKCTWVRLITGLADRRWHRGEQVERRRAHMEQGSPDGYRCRPSLDDCRPLERHRLRSLLGLCEGLDVDG